MKCHIRTFFLFSVMYSVKVLSDTHLEHYDTYPGLSHFMSIDTPIDIICLCGDIGDPLSDMYQQFLADCSYFCKVKTLVVYGNHEMYGKTQEYTTKLIECTCSTLGDKIQFLDNSTCDIGEYRFIGTILWTKLDFSKAWKIRTHISDFYQIKGWTLSAWQTSYEKNVSWLDAQLKQATIEHKKIIILTHHVPLLSLGHPKYAGSELQSAFASDLSDMINTYSPIIQYWFYGHDHYSTQVSVDSSTIVMSNQFGYQNNRSLNYDPSLIINI